MITQSTYSPSNPERVADWYQKAVYSGYQLITGPKRDPGYEYARAEMLDETSVQPEYEH